MSRPLKVQKKGTPGAKEKPQKEEENDQSKSRFSLSCCRNKRIRQKRVDARKRKGVNKEEIGSKPQSQGSSSESKRKYRSKSIRRRKKSRSRSRKRRSRKRRKRRSRKSRHRKSRMGLSGKKAKIIRENRAHLIKSQSLTAPTKSTEGDSGSKPVKETPPIASVGTPLTAFSPMKKDKRTKLSEDGAILKAAPPVLESNVRFQPLKSPEQKEHQKKEGDPPSTAIDIDSSMRVRRPKKIEKPQHVREKPQYDRLPRGRARKKEEEIRKVEEDKYRRMPVEEPTLEPGIQRVSDLIPLEEGIDPDYPAQRIVISNFVRNGCHVKRWLYEDSYPVDGPRPSIYDLMGIRSRKPYSTYSCGLRNTCEVCGRYLMKKQKPVLEDNDENDRIRGELQRLDVILKNLDD